MLYPFIYKNIQKRGINRDDRDKNFQSAQNSRKTI